jgi:ADP-ribose pyrophosphatase YjhB (NUDIX family)
VKKSQPTIQAENGRYFATSAAALQAVILNDREEVLLLSSPRRNGRNGWQLISGGMEAGETVLAGVLREVREEAGPIVVRPLGTIHAQSFHYDDRVRFMVSFYYLLAYEGGEVIPGDDMDDAGYRWWSLPALEAAAVNAEISFHPSTNLWLLRRAVQCYRLWCEERVQPADLQHRL